MTWAVVQTQAQREHAVRAALGHFGFETYLPRIRLRKRIVPLFQGYLFARLGEQFYPVLWCPHVIRLLWAPAAQGCIQPAKIDDRIIAELRKREVNGLVKLPQPPRLRRGQRVKVIRGSFEGQIGLWDGMSGRDRERVLLELLGRKVRIELSSADVLPLDVVIAPSHQVR